MATLLPCCRCNKFIAAKDGVTTVYGGNIAHRLCLPLCYVQGPLPHIALPNTCNVCGKGATSKVGLSVVLTIDGQECHMDYVCCSPACVKIRRKTMVETKKAAYQCGGCNKIIEQPKICSRCKCVYYCGIDCQKKDWSNHKKQCVNEWV